VPHASESGKRSSLTGNVRVGRSSAAE